MINNPNDSNYPIEEDIRPSSLNLMSRRLGIYGKLPTYAKPEDHKRQPVHTKNDHLIDGLNDQALRLGLNGGYLQQERMIFDKRRSLDRALLYSYQGANILKVSSVEEKKEDTTEFVSVYEDAQTDKPKVCRALINPDKNKQDYDDKIVSVHYEDNFQPGDVFEWMGTGTYWLIYLQDLTELAYFRGEIRRCSYTIDWLDEDGNKHTSYAAVRGPVETKINYIQKHQISVDTPNYSLHILMPLTDDIVKYFERYSKFYLQGCKNVAPKVCWRVEATDWISTPGIFELTAVEYYANETEDDVDKGLVGALVAKPTTPNQSNVEILIEGDTFIKPKRTYTYKYKGINTSRWIVQQDRPVKYSIDEDDPLTIYLMWDSPYSGEFTLSFGMFEKKIVVESLF